jgi:urease accessory protein
MITRRLVAPLVLLASVSPAFAHTGHDASSFVHGFAHPLGGLDHVLAMVAVGLYATMLGGRALWFVPGAFLGAMAIGGAMGLAGYALPYTEVGIAVSVIVLGIALAFRINVPSLAAMALAGLFAIFHGHAHGTEMPQTISGIEYAAGFLVATALLHALGMTLSIITARSRWRLVQASGAAIAVAGIALLVFAN